MKVQGLNLPVGVVAHGLTLIPGDDGDGDYSVPYPEIEGLTGCCEDEPECRGKLLSKPPNSSWMAYYGCIKGIVEIACRWE